jgi:hypothetical protein
MPFMRLRMRAKHAEPTIVHAWHHPTLGSLASLNRHCQAERQRLCAKLANDKLASVAAHGANVVLMGSKSPEKGVCERERERAPRAASARQPSLCGSSACRST